MRSLSRRSLLALPVVLPVVAAGVAVAAVATAPPTIEVDASALLRLHAQQSEMIARLSAQIDRLRAEIARLSAERDRFNPDPPALV